MMLLNKLGNYWMILILACFAYSCKKENPSPIQKEQFIKNFGNGLLNSASDVLVYENYYYLLGNSSGKNGISNIYLAKADEYGNQIWKQEFSINGASSKGNQLIKLNQQQGFGIIGTVVTDLSTFYSDICLLIVDDQGNTIKQQVYTDSLNQSGKCITELTNGEFFVAGTQSVNLTTNANAQLFFKTDASGTRLRKPTIKDGTNISITDICNNSTVDFIYVTGSDNNKPEIYLINPDGTYYSFVKFNTTWTINSIVSDTQNNILICGTQPNGPNGNNDVFLAKIEYQNAETEGVSVLWENKMGTSNYDEGVHITATTWNNYIITGTSINAQLNTTDIYLLECNNSGELVKSTLFGGSDNEAGIKSIEATDGKIATLSNTFTNSSSAITLLKLDWK
jgi:hypothetical protein